MFNIIHKKKKGLCLSGGGIKGFAHIGVLKALEENGIKFDMCCGNSAGSIVGGIYALGIPADELFDYALDMKVRDIINYRNKSIIEQLDFDSPRELLGSVKDLNISPAIDSKNIEDLFNGLAGRAIFCDTKIPFFAVATDLRTGKLIILEKGRIGKAVRASSAIPGVFTPVINDKYTLVDGLVLNNMPADILKERGCDDILSVNLKAADEAGTDSTGYIQMLMAAIDIMSYRTSYAGIEASDIVLTPYVVKEEKVKLVDSEYIMKSYQLGYSEAMNNMEKIVQIFG